MLNKRNLILSTQTQISEQECSDLTVTGTVNTVAYSHSTPKAFHEEPNRMLSQGRQKMCRRFWHILKISQKFAGGLKFGPSCYGQDENCTGIIQLWFIDFAASFFKALRKNVKHSISKFPKSIAGCTKRPRRPYV